jgi:hypothetical protein
MLTSNMKISEGVMVMKGGFTPTSVAAGVAKGSGIDMGGLENVAAIVSVGSPSTGTVTLKAQASVDDVDANYQDIPGRALAAMGAATDKISILNVRASDVSNILVGGVPCKFLRFVATTVTGPITHAITILGANFRIDPPTAYKSTNVAEIN